MMELKVWVDGIQRVICGVTSDTTCQDVVIALAHAMGRTGRFTLIEKWRDVERPLTPGEFPLRVLHKWGEYASEVRLHLCQSDSDRLKQREKHKQPDRFTHNFSPPKSHCENSVKRSSTFSGAHSTAARANHSQSHLGRNILYENGVSPRSSSHSSASSTRSSPNPSPHSSPAEGATRVPPRHSPISNGPVPFARHNVIRAHAHRSINDISPSNHHLAVSSSQRSGSQSPNRSSPQNVPRQGSQSPHRQSPGNSQSSYQNLNTETAVEHTLDSPRHSRQAGADVEEYDLDRNFPDILRDSKRPDRPSVHTEYRLEEDSDDQPESEKARLIRLVSIQKERLKVQESQMSVIETEIVSLESKENEYEHDLQLLTDDLVQLEQRERDDEAELADLTSVQWVDVLEQEQKADRSVRGNINDLKVKVTELEKKILEQMQREKRLGEDIERERKEVEKRLKDEEEKLKKDIDGVKEVITKTDVKMGEEKKVVEKVEVDLSETESALQNKQSEFSDLEAELKKVNLEGFSLHPGKPVDSGEAVLKILEGRLSPRPPISPTTPTQQAFINALASKNPNGVWV